MLEQIAKNLNLEEVEYKESIVSGLGAWTACATIEAVNYTPWWGGDYRTYVRDPETLTPKSYPTSETIKGVLRWVLRAALNAHLDTTIKELDSKLAKIYGGVEKEDRIEQHLDSLVRITVERARKDDKDNIAVDDVIARCLKGKRLSFEGTKKDNVESALKRAVEEACKECPKDCSKLREYLKLFNVPRVKLVLMPRREERNKPEEYRRRVLGILPVPPGELRIKIHVDVRKGFKSIAGSIGITPVDVCRLTLLALAYALIVHGLGRASARGFGRFSIENLEVKLEGLEETRRKIVEWMRILKHDTNTENVKRVINDMHRELITLAQRLAGRANSSSQKLFSPSLDKVEIIVKQNSSIRSVYDALYVIGCSTLKQKWKESLKFDKFAPGVNLHTWILGLPRWQQETGYTILENLGDDVCLPSDEVRRKSSDVRRKSTFVLFPLPNDNIVVAVGYRTYADHNNVINRLYHVGAHTDNVPVDCLTQSGLRRRKTGRRLSPGDVRCRHAVRVSYALSKQRVGPGVALDKCNGCCGEDNGGIYLPGRGSVTGSLSQVYQQAKELLEMLLATCNPQQQAAGGAPRRTGPRRGPHRGYRVRR